MIPIIPTIILGVYGRLYALSSSIIAVQECPRCIPSKNEKIEQGSTIQDIDLKKRIILTLSSKQNHILHRVNKQNHILHRVNKQNH